MPLAGSKAIHPKFHDSVRSSPAGESGMPDACTIHGEPAGDGDMVAGSLTWDPGAPSLVYSGACRYQSADRSSERVMNVGEETVTRSRGVVAIPWDAPVPEVGDVVTLTASSDPALVGRPLTIVEVGFDSFLPRRLLSVTDDPELPTPEG